jgi:hypothetical protein
LIDKELLHTIYNLKDPLDNKFKIVDGKVTNTVSGEVMDIPDPETVNKAVKNTIEILQILKKKESDK